MTRPLIPEIKVGKRYLWRPGVIEMACPKCGNTGTCKTGKTYEVIIERQAAGHFQCSCGHVFGSPEGWWRVRLLHVNDSGIVPYTELIQIEGEDYGE